MYYYMQCMWWSWTEIETYSVMYFTFNMLYCWTSLGLRLTHMLCRGMNVWCCSFPGSSSSSLAGRAWEWGYDAATKCVRASPLDRCFWLGERWGSAGLFVAVGNHLFNLQVSQSSLIRVPQYRRSGNFCRWKFLPQRKLNAGKFLTRVFNCHHLAMRWEFNMRKFFTRKKAMRKSPNLQ